MIYRLYNVSRNITLIDATGLFYVHTFPFIYVVKSVCNNSIFMLHIRTC